METVNWEEQWSLFAKNFYNGKSHIPIQDKTLYLKPGPGFGDLSHPTTALMLELLEEHVLGQEVLDIGSGSGILSLASLLLGAHHAIGLDIDPEAIFHSQENALLNGLQDKAHFSLQLPPLSSKKICLMNMIFPEQLQVEPAKFNPHAKLWITSGILVEQKEKYLRQTTEWGWTLIELRKKGGWLAALFQM